MSNRKTMIDEMDYETAMAALQEVISKLEAQEQSLDKSLSLFEQGQLLINRGKQLLEKAELKIKNLQDLELPQ